MTRFRSPRIHLLLFMTLAVLLFVAGIQPVSAAVRHINVRDGLSSRQVYEIEEDPDGFVWIYTNSGLDRFDGHNMKHYTLEPDEAFNDHIQSSTTIHIDPDGAVWIALRSGKIYRYNRELDRYDCVVSFTDPTVLIYNFIIEPDRSIVICTDRGLYRWTPADDIADMALDGMLTRVVIADGNGGYYAGTDHGLYHITGSHTHGFRSDAVAGTSGVHILTLAISSGNLYIGTFAQGVMMLSPDGTVRRKILDIPSMPINALENYGPDSLLVGVDGAGAYLINTDHHEVIDHYRDSDDLNSDDQLSGNTVTDILVDHNKGIWITTSHNGLNYLSPLNNSIRTIRSRHGSTSAPVSDYINVIFEDSDGDIWYGTDKGASRFSPSTGRWYHYLQSNDYLGHVVLTFGEDSHGRILIGTYGEGMIIVDKTTGALTRLPWKSPGAITGVGTKYVFAATGTPDGKIWIGGINGPLTCYDSATDTYRYYDEDCLATIIRDKDGEIFGGNKGVGTYSPETDTFTWTQTFDTITIRYPVRVLLSDPTTGDLWIGTQGDGLIRYNRPSGKARLYSTADGLSSNTIYSMARDNSGSIWVCTETDLYCIDSIGDRLTRLTDMLGTDSGVFNAGGGASTRAGEIMLGTAEGCVIFDPRDESRKTKSGNILFTDFRADGRSMEPGVADSPLTRNINLTDDLTLNYGSNSLDIGYVIIDYASPRRFGVKYTLEGYDHEEHTAGASGRISYNDLPPGTYTLKISAVDLYGGEPFAARTLMVRVPGSMWLSPWAIVCYTLVGIALLIFVIIVIRRVRRNRIIQSQLRSYAAIAHDIRTPMSMIKAPLLNIELDSELSDKARTSLLQARSGVDKTISMLDELLGIGREMHGNPGLQVHRENIRKYLQNKVEEYSTVAFFKGIIIESDVPDDMPEVMVDSDKFDHIVDNLLSNAIKYTNEGRITLKARLIDRRHWSLEVSDTGIGISQEDARHVFKRRHRSPEAAGCDSSGTGLGLLITRRLVTEHKARISFKSEPGQGSTFTVVFPLRYPKSCISPVVEAPVPDALAAQQEAETEKNDSRSTLYIIDDDRDILNFLSENLSEEYNVITSDNSTLALEDIKEKNPDLVISDVMMPGLRGNELCHLLKSNIDTSHIPVILLTGLAGRSDIVAGLEASADDYVVKPFDMVVLRARIRNIIRSRHELGRRVLAEDCKPAQEEFTNELDRKFMTHAMELIDANMANSEYSVNDLCSDLAMSRTSVYNKIKALTGQSPNEFMRIVRLNRAKDLLSTHEYNISEVAYMVGFSDPKYFSTCFKKQFGTSPSKI